MNAAVSFEGVITADVEQDETRDGRSRGTFHALTDLGAQVRAFVWAQ